MSMECEIDRLLNNWVHWRIGGRHGGGSSYPAYNLAPPSPMSMRDFVPVVNWEAEEVDAIIFTMPERYKQVIVIQYLWTDTQESKARRCGCCVNTLKTRLAKAKELLMASLYRAREKTACKLTVRGV